MNQVKPINFSIRSNKDIEMDCIVVLVLPLTEQPPRLPDFLPVTVNVPRTHGESLKREIRCYSSYPTSEVLGNREGDPYISAPTSEKLLRGCGSVTVALPCLFDSMLFLGLFFLCIAKWPRSQFISSD